MTVATYLGALHRAEQALAGSFRTVGEGHAAESDVSHMSGTLAQVSDRHVGALAELVQRYGEGEELDAVAQLTKVRPGPVGLLRDLQDLQLPATFVQSCWTLLHQASQALHDAEMRDVVDDCNAETSRQLAWLTTHLKAASPQVLLVSS